MLSDLLRREKYDVLVLLGDMYDFWYEYRTVIPKYAFLFTATVIMLARDKEVHYVSGNHDAWIGTFWRKAGVYVHRYGFQRNLGGRKILFTHGDYIFGSRRPGLIRALFHSGWANFLFSLLHPDLGIKLARSFSKESRRREEEFDFSNIDRIVSQKAVDVVISGHLHLPIIREVGKKLFVCPGDWLDNLSYALISDNAVEIKRLKDGIIMRKILKVP